MKEAEFGVLLASRAVLTPEQFEKLRAPSASAPSTSSREDAVKQKLERLKQLIAERERAGKPPRELECAVRDTDAAKAEQLADLLLRALGETPGGASIDKASERRVRIAIREAMQAHDVAEGVASAGASLSEPEEPVKPERPPELKIAEAGGGDCTRSRQRSMPSSSGLCPAI